MFPGKPRQGADCSFCKQTPVLYFLIKFINKRERGQNASAQFLPSFAGAPDRASPSSGAAVGYFLCQFQKRAVSNCFGWPGFGQARPKLLTQRLASAAFVEQAARGGRILAIQAVRNSAVFHMARKIPHRSPLKKERPGSAPPRKRRKELGRMRFCPGGSGKFCVRDDIVVLPYFV